MNIKIRNTIIFGVFLLILFAFSFTQAFGKDRLYPPEENQATPFDGLVFDQATSIDNLAVTRSLEKGQDGPLIKYDISFSHEGDPADVRILNTPVRNIFLPEGVQASLSKVTLKGDYQGLSASILENLELQDRYKKLDSFDFLPLSQTRIPLDEDIGDYAFTVYTLPRDFVYGQGQVLSSLGVFITNAQVDKFSDQLGLEEDSDLEPVAKTQRQEGTYVNSLELIDRQAVSRISTKEKLALVIFIISLALVLAGIWLEAPLADKLLSPGLALAVLSIHPALSSGVSALGAMIILPIMAGLGHVIGRVFKRDRLVFEVKDFQQALAILIGVFIISTFVFIVPRGI